MFHFLKSKTFWLTFAHVALVGAGAYASYAAGSPLPLVITGGLNALAPSPLPTSVVKGGI